MAKKSIPPKPHVHLQTMTKTHAKFQKDQNKTVREVALIKYTVIASTDGRTIFNSIGTITV